MDKFSQEVIATVSGLSEVNLTDDAPNVPKFPHQILLLYGT